MILKLRKNWQWALSLLFMVVGLLLLSLSNVKAQLPNPLGGYNPPCDTSSYSGGGDCWYICTYGNHCRSATWTPGPTEDDPGTCCCIDCPPPPTVQFASSTYTVVEGQSATILVTLSKAVPTTVTVQYATSDGSPPNGAVAGTNYTAASGTLTFPVNSTTASFTVDTRCNCQADPTLTVNLTLSNPSGAILGSQATAVLDILDGDRGCAEGLDYPF